MRLTKTVLLALVASAGLACSDQGPNGGPTSSLTVDLCGLTGIGWFAYQNQGGAWTQATPVNGKITFDATEKVSIAMSLNFFGSSFTQVINATAEELGSTSVIPCSDVFGDASMSGTVSGITGDQFVRIFAAASTDGADVFDPSWLLEDLPGQPVDIVATRHASIFSEPATRVVVRRNVTPANAAVPALNFAGAEAADLESAIATFNSIPANGSLSVASSIITPNGTFADLGNLSGSSTSSSTQGVNYVSVPAALRVNGDNHLLSAHVSNSQGDFEITHYYKTPGAKTLEFGPLVSDPTITTVASSPYMRLRAQVPAQAQYPDGAAADWMESTGEFSSRIVSVLTTRAFAGGPVQSWDIEIPDMSSAGYDPEWGIQTTFYTWSVTAYGSDAESPLLGQVPSNGATTRSSTRSNGQVIAFTKAPVNREAQAFARARAALARRFVR